MSKIDDEMPKLWHLIFLICLLAFSVWHVFSGLTEYRHIFLDRLAFARTGPGVLLGFCVFPILITLTILLFKHLKNPDYKNSERVMKTLNACIVFCVIGLFSPIIVGPLTSSYMKSHGYEKCAPKNTTAFTRSLNQYWAKPDIGCEVWDLGIKERDILRKELLRTSQKK